MSHAWHWIPASLPLLVSCNLTGIKFSSSHPHSFLPPPLLSLSLTLLKGEVGGHLLPDLADVRLLSLRFPLTVQMRPNWNVCSLFVEIIRGLTGRRCAEGGFASYSDFPPSSLRYHLLPGRILVSATSWGNFKRLDDPPLDRLPGIPRLTTSPTGLGGREERRRKKNFAVSRKATKKCQLTNVEGIMAVSFSSW